MKPEVTDQQLRDAGYTAAARNYPLSEEGAQWVARFNGIEISKMPAAWWYAPNVAMRAAIESQQLADNKINNTNLPGKYEDQDSEP